jgi:hypothetical protein
MNRFMRRRRTGLQGPIEHGVVALEKGGGFGPRIPRPPERTTPRSCSCSTATTGRRRSGELRKGSIDRIMGMSDLELGLQALLGGGFTGRR